VPTTTAQTPLPELIPRLNASPDGRALVLEEGRLVGVVSPTDVSRAIEHGTLHRVPPHESTRAGRRGHEVGPVPGPRA
jgi:CBS-domain-containing membrane protein